MTPLERDSRWLRSDNFSKKGTMAFGKLAVISSVPITNDRKEANTVKSREAIWLVNSDEMKMPKAISEAENKMLERSWPANIPQSKGPNKLKEKATGKAKMSAAVIKIKEEIHLATSTSVSLTG